MKVIKGSKKLYAGLSWYNQDKLLEANCKKRKRKAVKNELR
jgi:hypothetical protein